MMNTGNREVHDPFTSEHSSYSDNYNRYSNRQRCVKRLVQRLSRRSDRQPSPRDYKDIPKWNSDISTESPKSYLGRLTAHISYLSLNSERQLYVAKRAMTDRDGKMCFLGE